MGCARVSTTRRGPLSGLRISPRTPSSLPPGRRCGGSNEITPKEILTTPKGEQVVDMGQNMVGWVRLRVEGPAGTTVTLRHVEVLDKDGNVYTANLRTAQQTTTYTLKGERCGDVRAALHVPGLPLRAGRRLSRTAHARQPHRHHRALRDGRDRRVLHVARAAEPAAAQHPVGPEGELRRCPDRLSAARRAARLDG